MSKDFFPAFPRVLFITPCAFNPITGGGITFSNLFHGWPKGCLATVTDDPVPTTTDTCNQYYFLTSNEINYIRPFGWFYKRTLSSQNLSNSVSFRLDQSLRRRLTQTAKRILGEAGIPDHGMLSPELHQWINQFKPTLIYTILGTIAYVELVEKIRQEFDLPVVVHLMDEGVTDPKKTGFFGLYLRGVYRRKSRALIQQAKECLAIGDEMAKAYTKRFSRDFSVFQNTIDIQKWSCFVKKDFSIKGTFKLLYSGSVLPNAQLQSLKECCQAVEELVKECIPVELDIFAPRTLFAQAIQDLLPYQGVHLYDSISKDEDFFRKLGEADLLLLPVNFDADSRHFIRYSMPTKIPAYLTSGTPTLVYGPLDTAQVKYAHELGWGYVLSSQGVIHIKRAILHLFKDEDARKELSAVARETAIKNHDSRMVRTKFQTLLKNSIGILTPRSQAPAWERK